MPSKYKYKEFKADGWGPSVTVFVQKGGLCESKVEVSWSCMLGGLNIERATAFYKHFGKALQYARQQQKRLNRKATP